MKLNVLTAKANFKSEDYINTVTVHCMYASYMHSYAGVCTYMKSLVDSWSITVKKDTYMYMTCCSKDRVN